MSASLLVDVQLSDQNIAFMSSIHPPAVAIVILLVSISYAVFMIANDAQLETMYDQSVAWYKQPSGIQLALATIWNIACAATFTTMSTTWQIPVNNVCFTLTAFAATTALQILSTWQVFF